MFPLLQVSPLLCLFGLFGPALAAIIIAAVMGGRSGVKALLKRAVRWQSGARWCVVALGLPALLALGAAGLAVLLGGRGFRAMSGLAFGVERDPHV